MLRSFVAREFDSMSRRFDAKLRAELTPARLAVLRVEVVRSYGNFQSITEVRAVNDEKYRTIQLIAKWDLAPVTFSAVFDKDGAGEAKLA
jgi:hypothetical protein